MSTSEINESGNSTCEKRVVCIIRDPLNFDKFRENLKICNEKWSKHLVITFQRESVSFNGQRRIDFQNVVEGHTFEFPKSFFTCLLVPKGETFQLIVAKSSLLDLMPVSQRLVRIYLIGGDLTINGQPIDNVRVNRQSRFVTSSSSHGSSIRPLSFFKGKSTPATTPRGGSLPKQPTLNSSEKSGNVFSSQLSTEPGNEIPEKRGEEIKVRTEFWNWFQKPLTLSKHFRVTTSSWPQNPPAPPKSKTGDYKH